jgi:hypothetical protein
MFESLLATVKKKNCDGAALAKSKTKQRQRKQHQTENAQSVLSVMMHLLFW